MKIARIQTSEPTPSYAVIEGDMCRLIDGTPFDGINTTDTVIPLADVKLLAPVIPTQIAAIGLNYRQHATESGMALPEAPLLFVKTPNAITGHGAPILIPKMAPDEVDYECELVIVIGREAKNVSEAEALDYVLGYTCGNDVSARDCQLKFDKQWARGKCFDTFAPIGPWIETDLDGDNAGIRTVINGEVFQESNTNDLIFTCRELVSYLSQCMTLAPGSIIMTGTPSGVGFARDPQRFLKPGDTVSIEIEGIGTLTNPVVMEE